MYEAVEGPSVYHPLDDVRFDQVHDPKRSKGP